MTVNKHQKFKVEDIHRSFLVNAVYNPRKINDKQRAGLKRNLKKVGLISPIVWNRKTGNIVSGHQRISILDELSGTDDYYLSVAVVELDEKTEKEQNIFLNSTTFTGEFDFDALTNLLQEVDYHLAGLDEHDLNILGIYEDEQPDEEAAETFTDIEALKQRKKDARNEIDQRFDEGERYVTVSFDSYENKSAFMLSFGLNPDDLFIKGEVFRKIIEDDKQNRH